MVRANEVTYDSTIDLNVGRRGLNRSIPHYRRRCALIPQDAKSAVDVKRRNTEPLARAWNDLGLIALAFRMGESYMAEKLINLPI